MSKTRVTITIGTELNEWCNEESRRIGVPKSCLMAMMMENYKEQKVGMKALEEGTRIYKEEQKNAKLRRFRKRTKDNRNM